MKKLVAGVIIALVACVSVPSWVDAQQRDGGVRGRSVERRDSWRGRRRRYRGGRWTYEDPAPKAPPVVEDPNAAAARAVGGFLKGWFTKQQAERPDREPVRDVAWCISRYKSYNPRTQQYLGYDGKYHDCP